MTEQVRPAVRPARPFFSSGPCAKRPGWTPENLKNALLGRSHRSKPGKARLKEAIDRTRAILGVPADYRIAIVPASDTGAVEMAMWSLLGPLEIDIYAWESFGEDWVTDTVKQLKLKAEVHKAPYGQLPEMKAHKNRDTVFLWNGTTSGVKVPNGDWIASDRDGLTICDATSAVFAMDLPWEKLDVVTFSWQKVLGGEAAHGMLILSPGAVARLESYTPHWPLPKIFRMTKGGKIVEGIFEGETINTPSMLALEDYLDALNWAESVGGLKGLIDRSNANLKALEDWAAKSDWCGFLAQDKAIRSNTSVCLKIIDPWFTALDDAAKADAAKKIASVLEKEGVALDIAGYRAAPPGLRIWCGATVDTADVAALTPWLDWAWSQVKGA
ncbi:MAG: phosphoserine aminotransferase [Alphaproteobacteria bacterium 64-11]|nr:phosphoserine transaminase [Alphaproteobacteria bacterium]OJU08932.1 MAG: phosphoserine aminotransferase [Alphaproteobacteria bacterium 64-11]